MEAAKVVSALGALAHEHRLGIFRILVERGPEGLSAGAIAERLDLPPSSLTFHLHQLLHAGLITQRRLSRQLMYAADFTAMAEVQGYLTQNCCAESAVAPAACSPRKPLTPARARAARSR